MLHTQSIKQQAAERHPKALPSSSAPVLLQESAKELTPFAEPQRRDASISTK